MSGPHSAHAGAYLVDGVLVPPAAFYAVACDPQRSVVVEACAGAGKTWMLVSRMLRAMMAGTPPHQILAITFTRKAAGEMRGRLQEWMHEFAQADDGTCDEALRQRGVPEAELPVMRERLRGLQAAWMAEGRSVEIHTILGWFAKLVQGAPMDVLHELGLPPDLALIEDTTALWPQLWGRFLRRMDADAEARASFEAAIHDVGRHSTESWLSKALGARLELELADRHGRLDEAVPTAASLGAQWGEADDVAAAWMWPAPNQAWWALSRWLGASDKKTRRDLAATLEQTLTTGQTALNHADTAKALRGVLCTGKGDLRKTLEEAPDIDWLLGWLNDWHDALAQQAARVQHQRMAGLARHLLDEYRLLKRELAVADMVDLELAAARLMADPVLSGWVQERLDHQVRHVLMDEFQDTSPLQWHTLRAWLSAYAGAGGGNSGQQAPSVFLVGDPKQSIYRFRRADPRVFQAARAFVVDALAGAHLACDHTRRNAQGVIAALNAGMGLAAQAGLFPDFRTHTSASAAEGELRVLPQIRKGDAADDDVVAEPSDIDMGALGLPDGWRDTLRTPRYRLEASRREREAEQIAACVQSLIADEGVAPDEIFVLARRRVTLDAVAQSLASRQIAHMAPESDLLTDKLEVQDLMATVEALLSPGNNLALAHALRSPLMGVSDDELLWLRARLPVAPGTSAPPWLPVLLGLNGEASDAPASLRRAATLMTAWQAVLPQLPPHDLLERIVRDSDLRARLAARMPEGQAVAALCHVDVLLAHSLDANAGRDLTPYRWLRELRRNPPKLPPRAAEHAVQLLTVHGAKGLEAEVVILADMDAADAKADTYSVMIDWPEGEPAPLRCAFVASERRCPPSLRSLLEAEDRADAIEGMNALYVALTRAKRSLIFSSTQPRGEPTDSWWRLMHRAGVCPPPVDTTAWAQDDAPALGARHAGLTLPVLPTLSAPTAPPAQPFVPGAAGAVSGDVASDVALQAQTRHAVLGQWLHGVLERVTTQPSAQRHDALLQRALAAAQLACPAPADWAAADTEQLCQEALNLVRQVLAAPAVAPWLQAEGWAWAGNEVALADADGAMRLDRLVACRQADGRLIWWVMDYKLQHDPLGTQAYHQQMARYVRAVQRAQPGDAVGGAFITSGGAWCVWREPAAAP